MLAIKTSKSSVMIFALLDIACLLALASLVYGDDHGHHAGYGGAPTAARASSGYQQQSSHHQQAGRGYRHHRTDSGSQEQYQHDQESAGPTNYQFAYTAKAKGGPSAASYGGSGEYASGRTAAADGDDTSAEFGHTETHKDGRTEGKYFVQLPDGRLQSVVYHVEGDSGFVAEVQYEGGDQQQSGEHHNRQQGRYSATQ